MIWDVAGRFFFFKIFPEVFPSSFSLKNYKYLLPVNSLLLPVYQSVKLRWKNLQKWFKASKCEWVIYSRSCRKSQMRRFFSFSFILKKSFLYFLLFFGFGLLVLGLFWGWVWVFSLKKVKFEKRVCVASREREKTGLSGTVHRENPNSDWGERSNPWPN